MTSYSSGAVIGLYQKNTVTTDVFTGDIALSSNATGALNLGIAAAEAYSGTDVFGASVTLGPSEGNLGLNVNVNTNGQVSITGSINKRIDDATTQSDYVKVHISGPFAWLMGAVGAHIVAPGNVSPPVFEPLPNI